VQKQIKPGPIPGFFTPPTEKQRKKIGFLLVSFDK
jgi:hypothetical protein